MNEEFARHVFQLPGAQPRCLAMRAPNRAYPDSWTKSRFSTSVFFTVYRLFPRLGSLTGTMNRTVLDGFEQFEGSLVTLTS